ncbi:hypothetical protein [Rugosimonospora africana]|uniref:Carboxypeptidase regulatory-like domain-containing protein n=1 Tax=Rugosimonospora africana TaxID=556532 RepID=A0A8J3QSW5_9ACTN|nr:hypothetical protein [Rugosimonospora africana]GIH15839.1 hypothetical protein Raf01_40110 [Rugosimonospora africana]
MNVRKVLIVVVVAVVLTATGCSQSAGQAGPTGSVHGMIVLTGGMSQASPAGAPGTVVVSRGGDEVARQTVADGQEFRFTLSAGTYTLSAEGVDGACVDAHVTVTASADSAVSVTCQRK